MSGPRILMRREGPAERARIPAPETAWALLGGVGAAFALVGLADLALAGYPPSFGNRAWEFGTATAVLNGMPLFTMGLGLAFAATIARGSRILALIVSIAVALAGLVIVAVLVFYLRAVPTAQAAVTDPGIRVGLRNAEFKAVTQGVAYAAAFAWLAWQGFRFARRNE
jgi:hypothetical protein